MFIGSEEICQVLATEYFLSLRMLNMFIHNRYAFLKKYCISRKKQKGVKIQMKKIDMKVLAFTLVVFIISITVGVTMKLPIELILMILFVFVLVRKILGEAMHYENVVKCLLATIITITSIFLVAKVNYVLSLILAGFAAIIISEKGDIGEFFMMSWKRPEDSKYRVMKDYITDNKDAPRLREFESRLKKYSNELYEMYQMRFIEKLSYRKIEERTGFDNRKITNDLNTILLNFQMYFDIENEVEKNSKRN